MFLHCFEFSVCSLQGRIQSGALEARWCFVLRGREDLIPLLAFAQFSRPFLNTSLLEHPIKLRSESLEMFQLLVLLFLFLPRKWRCFPPWPKTQSYWPLLCCSKIRVSPDHSPSYFVYGSSAIGEYGFVPH